MEEELQKTERSYKNQVNFLLAGCYVPFYCTIPMSCNDFLEIQVVGRNTTKPFRFFSDCCSWEKGTRQLGKSVLAFLPQTVCIWLQVGAVNVVGKIFPIAYCPLCRESSGWREEGSSQPETKVSTDQTVFMALWTYCLLQFAMLNYNKDNSCVLFD